MAAVVVVLYIFYEHISQFCRNAHTKHSEFCSLSTTYFPHSDFVIHKPLLSLDDERQDEFRKSLRKERRANKLDCLTSAKYMYLVSADTFLAYFLISPERISADELAGNPCSMSWRTERDWKRKGNGGMPILSSFHPLIFQVFPKFYSVDLNESSVLKL